jgi:hypothetical protein
LSNIFSKKKIEDTVIWFTYITLFILFYYLASTIEGVSATVRYQIILYPLAMILSAIGIYQIINIEKIKKYAAPGFICLGVLIFSFYSLNSIRPFYFSYASDLLPNQYVLNLKDMGDGSWEAADYLNKLPDAKNLVVWTDKKGVCSFFVGNCTGGLDVKKEQGIDYFVISSGRESRTTKLFSSKKDNLELIRLDKLYSQKNYDYEIRIGNRPNNFVKIISAQNIE